MEIKDMKLSELFDECYSGITYQTAGEDVNYAFVEEGDNLTIFFQGSSQKIDWLRNFAFKRHPYKDMKDPYRVHRGFLDAWKEVEDIIIAKITEKNADDSFKWQHIIIVGYSHGAALSGLCHECVWYNRPDLRNDMSKLIGFGFEAPRFFGDYHVKQSLRERWATYYVFRNNTDIVTHLPPWILGYCQVGTVLGIGVGKSYGPIKSHYPQNVHDSLVEFENIDKVEK